MLYWLPKYQVRCEGVTVMSLISISESDPGRDICEGRFSKSDSSSASSSQPFKHPPSYLNCQGDTGSFFRPVVQAEFDHQVVKCLDSVFDDTTSDIFEEEKLKTYLRIRPASASIFSKTGKCPGEEGDGGKKSRRVPKNSEKILEVKDDSTVIAYPLKKNLYSFLAGRDNTKQTEYKFSKVFGPEAGQQTVFEECIRPLIEKFLRGENCLVFSYGATNSGKTYTLQGHGTDYGIIPRALDAIFNVIRDKICQTLEVKPILYQSFIQVNPRDREIILMKKERLLAEASAVKLDKSNISLSNSYGSKSSKSSSLVDLVGASPFDVMNYALFANSMLYSVWVSFAELYNERVYDALETVVTGTKKRRKELRLLQDSNGFVYVKDLTEIQVNCDEEAYKIFQAGQKNLQFASTQMNQNSSRSHSFFTLRVVTLGIGQGLHPYPKSVHRITFCDLAGMERVQQTENEGMRLKESGTINASLIVLLKVIRILREKQRTGNMMMETIPFRESKLTHLFKSFFTSSTHIRMIVSVNPNPQVAESTFQVLQNSAIASNVITFRNPPVLEPIKPGDKPKRNIKDSKPEVAARKKQQNQNHMNKGKVRFKGMDSTESENEDNSSNSSDGNKTDPPTVRPLKNLLQERDNRIQLLECENLDLRREVLRLRNEIEYIRDQSVKLLAEQNRLWSHRCAQMHAQREHLSNRRISLMRRRIAYSPGSKCGRDYTPPVLGLDEVTETSEAELKAEDEYDELTHDPDNYQNDQGDNDKENKAPASENLN